MELILRWRGGKPEHGPILKALGPDVLVLEGGAAGFSLTGVTVKTEAELGVVVKDGLWPGIRRAGSRRAREEEVASASAEPWVDANSYLVAYHRALQPGKAITLGYEANERAGVKPDVQTPFGTVELALVEARIAGGNFIVDLPESFREKLIAGDAKALEEWKNLARTARWLQQNEGLFGKPALGQVVGLVETGVATREIANLLHRRAVSPRLWRADLALPAGLAPKVIVAAGLKQIPDFSYRYVEGGGLLVVDQPAPSAAKMVRQEADRDYLSLGKGSVVAYKRRIVDPSEFALDVIDLLTHKQRATRLWNAQAAIPLATEGDKPGEALLHVVNYGSSAREEIQAHIQGHFSKARLYCPERAPIDLKTARRGPSTEVFLPALQRVATVRFSS
jgi:hypothetical protein